MSETYFEVLDQPGAKYYCWRFIDIRDVPAKEKSHYTNEKLTKEPVPPEAPEGAIAQYLGKRDWAGGWFKHSTLDDGQTDEEVLSSFAQYVDWVLSLPVGKYPHDTSPANSSVQNLMGAEDEWRWSGKPEDRNPPCRCEHCESAGKIIISH